MDQISAMYGWLAVGVLFLVLEAVGVPGAGLIFAGLGALVTGTLLHLGMIEETDTLMQLITFFASTGVFAVILWKPIQKFKVNQQTKKYNNIVGETARVGKKGLNKDGGQVKWSGTTMRAELSKDAGDISLEPNTAVTIVDMEGTTLIVKPKE